MKEKAVDGRWERGEESAKDVPKAFGITGRREMPNFEYKPKSSLRAGFSFGEAISPILSFPNASIGNPVEDPQSVWRAPLSSHRVILIPIYREKNPPPRIDTLRVIVIASGFCFYAKQSLLLQPSPSFPLPRGEGCPRFG
jgi:hypothetical protein